MSPPFPYLYYIIQNGLIFPRFVAHFLSASILDSTLTVCYRFFVRVEMSGIGINRPCASEALKVPYENVVPYISLWALILSSMISSLSSFLFCFFSIGFTLFLLRSISISFCELLMFCSFKLPALEAAFDFD